MAENENLRRNISQFIGFNLPESKVDFEIVATAPQQEYTRYLIHYQSIEGDKIEAFLLIPKGQGPFPAVLVHHQLGEERHYGKSKVCGLIGESIQAFGHILANRGMVVLAPDAIGYEDRRRSSIGVTPSEMDKNNYYNEICFRLLVGDNLFKKVLMDAALGITLLAQHPAVDKGKIGTLGNVNCGNLVIYHAALDERINFTCSSSAICSYRQKMISGTPVEMFEIIPGFVKQFDIPDLVKCIAPRKLLLICGIDDRSSKESGVIYDMIHPVYKGLGAGDNLQLERFQGGTALNRDRFKFIIDWLAASGTAT